jgi:hypothetical protein
VVLGVALVIATPVKTASATSEVFAPAMNCRSFGSNCTGLERNDGVRTHDDISPTPRRSGEQLPAIARSARVFREQYIWWLNQEMPSTVHLKTKETRQRDVKLTGGRIVPLEVAADWSLSERDGMGLNEAAKDAVALARQKINPAFLEVRVAIAGSPNAYPTYHRQVFLRCAVCSGAAAIGAPSSIRPHRSSALKSSASRAYGGTAIVFSTCVTPVTRRATSAAARRALLTLTAPDK